MTSTAPTVPDVDLWRDWLLSARHGGDDAHAAAMQRMLDDISNRVLDNVALAPELMLADIGCGYGLVALRALEREPSIRATLVDISPALIAHARTTAKQLGVTSRCCFIVAPAESLEAIADSSIDRVTVRAVIAYIADKPAAVGELHRILRSGGRVSIVDPIFADRAFGLAAIGSQLRAGKTGAATSYFDYLHRIGSAHLPDTLESIARNPLTNYNERDLVTLLEVAGFVNIHLRLHIDCVTALPMSWETYLATSPRAGVPTIAEILETRFNANEREDFERLFRPRIEAGTMPERNVNAYIFADKAERPPAAG